MHRVPSVHCVYRCACACVQALFSIAYEAGGFKKPLNM
jgi:hypothetical protein